MLSSPLLEPDNIPAVTSSSLVPVPGAMVLENKLLQEVTEWSGEAEEFN